MTANGGIRGCGILAAGSALLIMLSIALFIRGCMNEHYRSEGQGYVTFSISAQGDKLVFDAVGDGGRDLYALDLNSLAAERLAATPLYEVDPSFSLDGNSVVYAAGKPGERADHVFVRRLDRNEVKQLTAEDANDSSPEFSPDGSRIVFTRDKTYNWGGLAANWGDDEAVCVINVDGSGFRQITSDRQPASGPHFSPDGRTILFGGEGGLYAVPADASQSPSLLSGRRARDAVYSPDGQSIAFVLGKYASDQEIFTCRADGLVVKQVTHVGKSQSHTEGAGCTRPAFMPDGKRILFFLEIWPDGPRGHSKQNLWEIGIDGSGLRKIADYGLFDDPLHWKPDAAKGVKAPGAR
jgi:Tol biopolymer transport system component